MADCNPDSERNLPKGEVVPRMRFLKVSNQRWAIYLVGPKTNPVDLADIGVQIFRVG